MEKIKPYLHFYYGKKCLILRGDSKFFDIIDGKLLDYLYQYQLNNVKPLLRHISSITDEECLELAKLIYGKPDSVKWKINRIVDNNGNFQEIRMTKNYYMDEIIIDEWGGVNTYETEDAELRNCINPFQHETTIFLLSKGFWIFDKNAFKNGLVLDINKIYETQR